LPPTLDAPPQSEAKPGEPLPPAKHLAAVLGVNTNTAPRALRVLCDERLLEFRRGHGISVAGTPERGAVITRAGELVGFALPHGYRLDERVKIIADIGFFSRPPPRGSAAPRCSKGATTLCFLPHALS
jgi:GntR family transcriptional regulator